MKIFKEKYTYKKHSFTLRKIKRCEWKCIVERKEYTFSLKGNKPKSIWVIKILYLLRKYLLGKSGMAEHIWKKKWNHLPLRDKVEIIERAEHWRIRRIQHICLATMTCWGCPRGVMVKAMNCGIVVREFVLQSRYYVHFRANTLGKGMNPLILPPAMDK